MVKAHAVKGLLTCSECGDLIIHCKGVCNEKHYSNNRMGNRKYIVHGVGQLSDMELVLQGKVSTQKRIYRVK